ncbi:MAG: hypothetical protein WC758_04445 [Candidatus Woesearchaeota archaeon]|jgi:hypothetical protein
MTISEQESKLLLSNQGKVWNFSVEEEVKILLNRPEFRNFLNNSGKSISDADFKQVSEAEVADKVFDGKFPDVYCIFGRGIERRNYVDVASVGDTSGSPLFKLSNEWYSTPFFEQVSMPRRTHTGVGIHPETIDLNASNVRFAGAGESVFASYVLLKGLADMGRFPKQLVFAAGRTECLLDFIFEKYDLPLTSEFKNDKNKRIEQMLKLEGLVNPVDIISEGTVLSNELLSMLSYNNNSWSKANNLKYSVKDYQENGLTKTHTATINVGSSTVDVVRIPNNFDTRDDAKVSLDLTNDESISRFMTIGVHAPRSQLLIDDLIRTSDVYTRKKLDAKMISADNVLKLYMPVFKTLFMALEEVPAYMRTCVDENAGAQKLL